jgi:hypothetical protein
MPTRGSPTSPPRGGWRVALGLACAPVLATLPSCGASTTDTPPGLDASPDDDAASSGSGGGDAGTKHDASADAGHPTADSGAKDAATVHDAGPITSTRCKRGIGTNTPPSAALSPTASSPGVHWWYDWGNAVPSGASPVPGISFVPMIWGTGALAGPVPGGSTYVLGFNEPNFSNQSALSPQQAAFDWPKVQALAQGVGARTVSPGVNFCGSPGNTSGCSDPAVTDPYTWLKDFFAACSGCEVDAIAVHWYNCDLPSLMGYIDGNGSLQGFTQFGKPIWLTEFACDNSHSVADQTAYMQSAVKYLEGNAHVARYSWFNASAIPNALLENSDGSLTPLGQTYVSLPGACP